MGIETSIEWCDSTLNLMMGCDGCELWNPKTGVKHCYAGTLHERYAGKSKGYPAAFDQPTIFPQRIDQAFCWKDLRGTERPEKPWLNGYPRLVFLNDLGDTFTESLPLDWMVPWVDQLARTPHIYIVLTKRPKRMAAFWKDYGSVPKNFWLLVSVTGPENAGRIGELLSIEGAPVLGVSYEPALGPVDFKPFIVPRSVREGYAEVRNKFPSPEEELPAHLRLRPSLDWAIFGAESGGGARRCDLRWSQPLLQAGYERDLAVFMKQIGRDPFCSYDTATGGTNEVPVATAGSKGEDWSGWPEIYRLRQMPKPRF